MSTYGEGKVTKSYGDDELRTTVHLPNIAPIGAKLRQNAFQKICNFRFFDAEKNWSKIVFGVNKSKIANRLKRVLTKFRADRSYVWEVNGRSKFVIAGLVINAIPF